MGKSFITAKPKSSLIRKWIAYYYFHKDNSSDNHEKFIYYPNYLSALTIYKGSKATYEGNASISLPDEDTAFYTAYSGIQNTPRIAEIKAPFNKVGIVFTTLGLNHFVRGPLSKYISHTDDKTFTYFQNDIFLACEKLYNTENIEEKVDILDEYFCSHYQGFHEIRLIHAISILSELDENLTVHELANRVGIHRKTLLRMFRKHLNCTVKDFVSIVKFRRALISYQNSVEKPKLTELAYEYNYYDQSEFIHHFKKTTGFNPKKFLTNLENIGDENTFFTFL